ncbi:2Fe-2S iron-sulfur cluster-binding protein [Roseibium sediminicola]|uniref:4Fe-4S dicluster domain-containing protein n=1 Tax=Roseibium sediminicola TaxID=2933272 RepID=A0ABT0H064_9HYPH|nr:reductive dehalogenase domain-containing protein [Roseibium sp. CAU 1639]MCK7615083.1 4Fe-4S dicluster domain-containing protein [Roseibium sp. CAU 1639]
MERLARQAGPVLPADVPAFEPLVFSRPGRPENIVNAMTESQAMLDAVRDGLVNGAKAEIPEDLVERQNHLKAFGYFSDVSMAGTCALSPAALLERPVRNPDMERLAEKLRTGQHKSLASGIEMIMADLRDAMNAPEKSIRHHRHALVFMVQTPRPVRPDEPGFDWLEGAERHRSALRAMEVAVVLAQYIRLLGYEARAHGLSASDVDLNVLAVASGLASVEEGQLRSPYLGDRFALAVVTTDLPFAHDLPLKPLADQPRWKTHGPAWKAGYRTAKSAGNLDPYEKRRFVDGAHPFETLKRVDEPTTFIDEARVPRVPKRTDMFARSLFGDLGKKVQQASTNGQYVRKSAPSMAQRRALGAFVLLQDGDPGTANPVRSDPLENAQNLKAMSYFLGVDAVGVSRCPDWTWYSHDAAGAPIDPPHDQAISMVIDQGYETMEGASGDDWIAVSQSMRAYLRFSILGCIVAQQIRNLGYKAKAHTVIDGEVLQPPLLLLSGLGEVSRIGEVILNPFLGPRLKSGAVTTTMPLAHDKPISFGLQSFCEACNKCARECPSGAITAGPKLMFNGYEIWKSDSQKCTTYRITNEGGAMCGRCMKTCPWNLEGIFAEAPFRWAAMNLPKAAPLLAKLDDMVGNGEQNLVKKWWWDLELSDDGAYRRASQPVNDRPLQKDLDLKFEDQTLAVYPATLAPHPWPFPYPMDREKGIEAYQALITAEEYKARLARGDTKGLAHEYRIDGDAPVIQVQIVKAEAMTGDVSKYEFASFDGAPLPDWTAGAHIDIVVAPEFLRQYSLSGNPADLTRYQIGVLREPNGRGGSQLLHRIFTEGRKIFISRPINHFPLVETARRSFLMGGGIGVTPMIAMAHRLHAIGADFELHYSCSTRASAGYLKDLASFPWADKVYRHFSDEGTRADFDKVLAGYRPGDHVYCCGAVPYMDAVMAAAERCGFAEDERHLEYFNVPEMPDYENHAFTLKLARSGLELEVAADESATDALAAHGIHVDVKCSDGICGVCKCGLVAGEVEHRDFVLSKKQRETAVILCQSRAADAGGVIEVDL